MKTAAMLITVSYTLLLLYWMFFGFGRTHLPYPGYQYNLIPFHTIKMYMLHADHFNAKNWAINVVGNIAVFMPFGLAVPYLRKMSGFRFILLFVVILLMLECLQLISQRGSFDVDDLMLNTVGALLGYWMYRRWFAGGAKAS
ncbi:VanZ family protein [Paenibacillus methanolicus]|uniref:VanZ like protein n=1 Tax=Paenibacillus methanolicus TaxID=582686 RepID=A0A5S5C2U6_9BACL|nr:VanZ family protein [Paenibacillus methanolicus]TYP73755.1 VanZ like protein [Paenibacillus methanolicus]